MRQPDVFTPREIQEWNTQTEAVIGGRSSWLPARCMGHNLRSWTHRFRTAWLVFIGRYDALDWEPEAEYKRSILKNNHTTLAKNVEVDNSFIKSANAALGNHWAKNANVARHMVNVVLDYYNADEEYLAVTPLESDLYIGFGPYWADITDPEEILLIGTLLDIHDDEVAALTEVRAFWYNNTLHFTSGGRSVSSEWSATSPIEPTMSIADMRLNGGVGGDFDAKSWDGEPREWGPIVVEPLPITPAMVKMDRVAPSTDFFMDLPLTRLLDRLLIAKGFDPINPETIDSQQYFSEPASGLIGRTSIPEQILYVQNPFWVKALKLLAPEIAHVDEKVVIIISVCFAEKEDVSAKHPDYNGPVIKILGFTNHISPLTPLPAMPSAPPATKGTYVKMLSPWHTLQVPPLPVKPTPPPGRVGYEHQIPQ